MHETLQALEHRGPDDRGLFREPSIGLAHTRLSIVDLDPRSNQPFRDRTGRYVLVYNGEIYNFVELRAELEKRGVSFRTTGDTEVLLESLLHAYDLAAALRKLEGMFAFGLYDRQERTLLLARDRIGMKPLYYYQDENRFVFSSEIQAMRSWIPWKVNQMMIFSYLNGLDPVTEGHDLYEGVKTLAPGSFLKIKRAGPPEIEPFFKLSDFWDAAYHEQLARSTPAQVVDLVEQKLRKSVEIQLRSDARIGTFCSGGVDSSLITTIASQLRPNLTIFHCNIVGKCSEYEAAKALAEYLKLEFASVDVRDEDYLERIPDTIQRTEYPYRHLPTSTPILILSELARSHGVKALLSGEASDETFLGYDYYAPDLLHGLRKVLQLPEMLYQRLKGAHPSLPRHFSEQFYQHFRNLLEKEEIRSELLKKVNGKFKHRSLISLNDFSEQIRALTHRNDSLGMAASIETRFPFLDSEVVFAGISMPDRFKLRISPTALDPKHLFIRDKWVIRKIADRYLPKRLSRRIKVPFPTTFMERMRIRPEFFENGPVQDWLSMSRKEIRYFCEHAPGRVQNTLMYLNVWAHVCFYKKPKSSILEHLKKHIRITPERRKHVTTRKVYAAMSSDVKSPALQEVANPAL